MAHDTSHAVGLRAPEVKDGVPTPIETVAQLFPAKPHGKKRKKRESIRQYSKKEGKAVHCKQGQGKGPLRDAKALESTGFLNLTDTTSSIDPAQSLGDIRKRLIALAQSSLKILELEVSDEGPEMDEAVIQPSIEAPASINGAPGATKPRGTIAGWNKATLTDPAFFQGSRKFARSNLGHVSPAAAEHGKINKRQTNA